MDSVAFRVWLNGIRVLDPAQRGQAMRELALAEAGIPGHDCDRAAGAGSTPDAACLAPPAKYETGDGAAAKPDLMTRIGQGRLASVGCPHCDSDDIRPWGAAGGKPRYRCAACRKTFNPLTGTPLSGLHYPDRWHDQAQALIAGETIAKAAARCDIDCTTAFRWRHRFLKALTLDKPASLSGIVEADEAFILESFKGKRRGLPRASRKRGGKGQCYTSLTHGFRSSIGGES
jgi:transposase-like protein